MNWFTKSHIETVSLDKKKAVVAEWGGSELSLAEGGTLWQWYDSYVAPGGESVPVRGKRRQKERRLARVRKDRKGFEWEQNLCS